MPLAEHRTKDSFPLLFIAVSFCLIAAQGITQAAAESDDVHVSLSRGFDALVDTAIDTISLQQDPYDETDTVSRTTGFGESMSEDEHVTKLSRRRRSIIIDGGPGGGISVQGISAIQTCKGITLEWMPLNLPFSSKFAYINSEFRYYNIYRSRSFFSDVTNMSPYASGKKESALRLIQTNKWTDRYPAPMVNWFYAITVVDWKGREGKTASAQRVMFVGAFQKKGGPVLMIPSILRGRVMHHSVAYNPNRNEYFVAFDLDINNDGKSDNLYGVRLNQMGQIVEKTILNFTANIPGWAGGEQGWPSVTFNPRTNEYLALFHFRSKRHFFNKFIILGQRIMTKKTERAAAPSVVVKATSNKGQADAKEPRVLYNPVTGGYVASLIIAKPKKDVFSVYLNVIGSMLRSAQVCSFTGNAYEHNIFLDSKRKEFFFTCMVEKRGARFLDVMVQNKPYIVVMTKMNASGHHAANTPTQDMKNLVSFTSQRHGNLEGYYNDRTDRLALFWEDTKNGRHIIQTAIVLLTRLHFKADVNSDECQVNKEIRTPVPLPLPISGSHYLLWQERSRSSWSIGGRLLQGGNFNLANREQKKPVVVHNIRADWGFVVWQEVVGNQVNLIGRHFGYSTAHSCSPLCAGGQRCAQQDTCIPSGQDGCTGRPCSHTCQNLPNRRFACSCPDFMELSDDQQTCKNREDIKPCYGMTPLKNPSTNLNYFCGRGPSRVDCPSHSYCHVHPTDVFAVCCKNRLPSYTILVANEGFVWQTAVNPSPRTAKLKRLQFTQGFTVVAVAYDPVEKRIYWSDVGGQKISRAYMTGRGVEPIIITDISVPDGLCLDTADRKIYWTDTGLDRIERANLDGSNRHILQNLGLDQPRAIVLYRTRRQMYWTDWGLNPKIERASMDGGQRKTIITGGLGWPNGLVIDESASTLYWADARVDKIETSDLEGRNRRVLVGGKLSKHPFSLAILNDRLFWSDWETASVQSVDKSTGKDLETVLEGLKKPKGIFLLFSIANSFDVSCPDPGAPLYGNRHPRPGSDGNYAVGATVIFSCNPDYVLIGSARRICQKSGKWSGKPTSCAERPVFTAIPKNTTVTEGDSTLLKCSASVRGRSLTGMNRIKWYKDGIAIPAMSDGHYFTGYNGHLIFLVVHYSDLGLYTCKATTEAGTIEAVAYLKVRGLIKMPECGNPTFFTRSRIVGGKRADRGAHPWQAMLWNKAKKRHFCGGTLITNRWIVTAAHCVFAPETTLPSLIKVRLGKHVRTKKENNEQSVDADMIKIHPRYSPDSYDSDIALIRLAKNVTFTDYVKPICLPSDAADYGLINDNTTGIISGWGSRKMYRNVARRLHEAAVPIVDQKTCRLSHPDYVITANMFCAGHNDSSVGDACQGDSGGPFAVENRLSTTPRSNHRYLLLGVISWGDGCGKKGKYGVYTRVTNFIDWILSEIDY